jgi:DNA-binding HxlR family transcriptional regulator
VQEPNHMYVEQVSRVIELLQGKWTVQILCAMRERPKRLSELRRAIPSASKKALTASLRSLEAARIVLRQDLSSSVLRVEYEIADTIREPLQRSWTSLQIGVAHTVQTRCQRILRTLTIRQFTARTTEIFNAGASSFVQV